MFDIELISEMKQDIDDVTVKRETSKIWLGIGLAIFGCLMILVGVCIPPVGVIDGSLLAAVGELFSLAGACLSLFSINKRNNAKIDSIYKYVQEHREDETETDTEI